MIGTEMSDSAPASDAQCTGWLDASPDHLSDALAKAVDDAAALLDRIADMQDALAACRRHPDATTVRDACQRDCLLSVRQVVA